MWTLKRIRGEALGWGGGWKRRAEKLPARAGVEGLQKGGKGVKKGVRTTFFPRSATARFARGVASGA